MIQSKRDAIADFAQTRGLPLAVVGGSAVLPASGLIAYGPMRGEYAHLAARYIDRILRGAKPGYLSTDGGATFRGRIIAVTGYGRDNDITRAREAGFDAHLVKPYELDAL